MTTTTIDWTFEGYWNTVLGADRSAADVVAEYDLEGGNRPSLSEWLSTAESEAWQLGRLGASQGAAWGRFHEPALDALCDAASA